MITGNEGGGLRCLNSSAAISNNTVSGNGSHGIVCMYDGSPNISNNTISENNGSGILISGGGSSPLIRDNRITGNFSSAHGGGISCANQAGMSIFDNTIEENTTSGCGGGVYCDETTAAVLIGSGNEISNNEADLDGGGLCTILTAPYIIVDSCRISTNSTAAKGGGVFVSGATYLSLANALITGNDADDFGGGIHAAVGATITADNCTISNNSGLLGGGMFSWGTVDISDSIIRENDQDELNGEYSVSYSNIAGGWPGKGNIDADPLFVSGPFGGYYLGHVHAGQQQDSPCIDAGDPASTIPEGTTRIDHIPDLDIVDMGYHYPLEVPSLLVLGPGPGV